MKTYIFPALTALFLTAFVSGCVRVDEVERMTDDFRKKSQMGLYGTSSNIFGFDEENCQYAVSDTALASRIQTDDLSRIVSVTFGSAPELNATIDVEVTIFGLPGSTKVPDKVKVIKAENGKVWLLDAGNKTCYIMPW